VKAFLRIAIFGALASASSMAHAALFCTLPSSVSLNFGNYDDSSAANTDVSTTFSVSCCRNPPGSTATLTVAMGPSTNSGGINTRQMKNGANADLMSYQLYFNSFGGTVWGDGVIGGSTWMQAITLTSNCPATVPIMVGSAIFGRIFAQQAVSAGSYADTLTISITP
jgi:spore coat protein U-like protein